MAESELHRRLKYAIAKALVEMGYQSGVEVPTGDGGYVDVQGKRGKGTINIELIKTHTPDWLIIKFQEAKEVRENLYTVAFNRISKNGKKNFHAGELIESLVGNGYFDTESATKYVEKRLGTTGYVQKRRATKYEMGLEILELLDSNDIVIGSEEQGYVCDTCAWETKLYAPSQNECSHILKRKKAIQSANTILNALAIHRILSNPSGDKTLDKILRLEWV